MEAKRTNTMSVEEARAIARTAKAEVWGGNTGWAGVIVKKAFGASPQYWGEVSEVLYARTGAVTAARPLAIGAGDTIKVVTRGGETVYTVSLQ